MCIDVCAYKNVSVDACVYLASLCTCVYLCTHARLCKFAHMCIYFVRVRGCVALCAWDYIAYVCMCDCVYLCLPRRRGVEGRKKRG